MSFLYLRAFALQEGTKRASALGCRMLPSRKELRAEAPPHSSDQKTSGGFFAGISNSLFGLSGAGGALGEGIHGNFREYCTALGLVRLPPDV